MRAVQTLREQLAQGARIIEGSRLIAERIAKAAAPG